MLCASVVLEGNRFFAPTESAMEFEHRDMVEEHLKHRIAFDLTKTLDTGREVLVYE